MLLHVLCIRDRAADTYGRPTFHLSTGAAIRGFTDELNRADSENIMYKHPDDFDLYVLGTYDDATAHFELLAAPRMVAVGKDVVVSKVK